MAKDNYTEITPEVLEAQEEAEFEEDDFDEIEEKHPVKDFVGKHKKKLMVAGLAIVTFALGCVTGSKVTKKDNSDSSDEALCIEENEEQESEVVESTATEVEQ